MPTAGRQVNAIILAASQGDLGELTKDIPKTLLKVNGKSLLSNQINDMNKIGIKDIAVVRGFGKEQIAAVNITTVDNDEYAETKDLYSLYLAKDKLKGTTVVSYGDIIYKSYILNELFDDNNDVTLIIDPDFDSSVDGKNIVITDQSYSKTYYSQSVGLVEMTTDGQAKSATGEFIGIWKVSEKGAQAVKDCMEVLSKRPDFKNLMLHDLFNELVKVIPVRAKFVRGLWLDVNNIVDLHKAGDLR